MNNFESQQNIYEAIIQHLPLVDPSVCELFEYN